MTIRNQRMVGSILTFLIFIKCGLYQVSLSEFLLKIKHQLTDCLFLLTPKAELRLDIWFICTFELSETGEESRLGSDEDDKLCIINDVC